MLAQNCQGSSESQGPGDAEVEQQVAQVVPRGLHSVELVAAAPDGIVQQNVEGRAGPENSEE